MQAGRPTDYNNEILAQSEAYLESCVDEVLEYPKTRGSHQRKVNVKLPTIEGLARHLGVSRSTIYKWKDQHIEFSDILDRLSATQADRLINNGLSGNYNATITKLILAKHGYREGKDAEEQEKITGNVIIFRDFSKRDSDEEVSKKTIASV